MTEHHRKKCCAPEDAGYDIGNQRQHYFEGKYMTARDFRDEQHYFLSHRHAHNRLLHGWGVVCGLRVDGLEREGCQDRWVKVNSGIALDCYGRELVVEEEFCVELPDKQTVTEWEECGYEKQLGVPLTAFPMRRPKEDIKAQIANPVVNEVAYLICLAYFAEMIESVPALLDGDCAPREMEYNRVRETVRVVVVRHDELKNCWLEKRKSKTPPQPRLDCDDDPPGPAGTCIEPDCPCGRVVPLALVRAAVADGYLVDDFRLVNERQAIKEKAQTGKRPTVTLELDGRRRLPTPPSFLTHIVGINWPHGGILTISELEKLGNQLEVVFDRTIQSAETANGEGHQNSPYPGEASGINRFTFQVSYGDDDDNIEEFYIDREKRAKLDDADKPKAVYFFSDRALAESFGEYRLHIRLLCDFVLDCHDNAVDGNFIGGRLPSGNGSPGGVFESWFRLQDDRPRKPDARKRG